MELYTKKTCVGDTEEEAMESLYDITKKYKNQHTLILESAMFQREIKSWQNKYKNCSVKVKMIVDEFGIPYIFPFHVGKNM